METTGLIHWRLESAQVHLSLGNHAQAARLLREQLDTPWPLDGRTRGRTLRLLARTAPPDRRGALLSEAVDQLQAFGVGDTLELSRALVDLAAILRQDQEPARCLLLLNRAHELAQESGADALAQRIREDMVGRFSTDPNRIPSPRQADDGLTRAERRVGALAAQGMSNREISGKLFITVSTVEQHLTRIYRKLDVKRRDKLPAELAAYTELDPVLSGGSVPAPARGGSGSRSSGGTWSTWSTWGTCHTWNSWSARSGSAAGPVRGARCEEPDVTSVRSAPRTAPRHAVSELAVDEGEQLLGGRRPQVVVDRLLRRRVAFPVTPASSALTLAGIPVAAISSADIAANSASIRSSSDSTRSAAPCPACADAAPLPGRGAG